MPSADEWGELYKMAKKHSLVGVCFAGVQKLGFASYENPSTKLRTDSNEKHLGPSETLETIWNLPEMDYLRWMGMAAKILQKNEVVNRHCVELQNKIAKDGHRSYIMKGQAVGTLYGSLAGLRQSGDIDVYIEGGLGKVLVYARTYGEVTKVNELEMSVNIFPDTEVEFHYRPFIMRNPLKNAKLQASFEECAEGNFNNTLNLSNSSNPSNCTICAPTTKFNLVHQLVHTYHHFITEGVGLRQLMDYYFVVQASNAEDIRECQKMVDGLGLNRFASALTWILMRVFGLEVEQALWTPCEKDGRMLLDKILLSGNFGHTDKRAKDIQTNRWKSFWYVNGKTFRFWRFDHWAWFWSPLWRIYHHAWRVAKGYK